MTDLHTARMACLNLSSRFPPGVLIALPGGRELHVLRPAIHSETLEPVLVLALRGAAGGPELTLCAPGAARMEDEEADLPEALHRLLGRQVFRHRKGGTYTRIGQAVTRSGEMTVYAAHADGLWWVRPRVLFDDGRFQPVTEACLSLDELGLSA